MIYRMKFCKCNFFNFFKAVKIYKNYPLIDTGIVCFSGCQGSGKTSSLCAYLECIKEYYGVENLDIYSNMPLTCWFDGLEIKYTDFNPDMLMKSEFAEGKLSIIVIDELQILFNSLESKSIPLSYINTLCQLRKSHVLILGTSQVYQRIAKPYREQMSLLVLCNKHWVFQLNHVYDLATQGIGEELIIDGVSPLKTYLFIPCREYAMYDTSYKILRNGGK